MMLVDDSPYGALHVRAPALNIPQGSRWVKITNPHQGQVVKIRRSTDVAVFYQQEKPGDSQGRNNGQHRSDRQSFFRDFEPYARHDWVAAQRVLDQVRASAAIEDATPQEEPPITTIISDERAETQADLDAWGVPATLVHEDVPEEEAGAEEAADAERPTKRLKLSDIPEAEQDEIVDCWRTAVSSVADIAATYNTTSALIYNVVAYRVPDEYRLQRIVDQLKRAGEPIPAYQVSQWMHLGKAQVEELCTSEAGQQVLRYFVDVRDPKKPWIKTPMIELLPAHAAVTLEPTESEPTVPTQVKSPIAAAVDATLKEAATLKVVAAPVPTPAPEPEAAPYEPPAESVRSRRWKVQILTIIETTVEAPNLLSAHAAAFGKFPDATDIIGVVEDRA